MIIAVIHLVSVFTWRDHKGVNYIPDTPFYAQQHPEYLIRDPYIWILDLPHGENIAHLLEGINGVFDFIMRPYLYPEVCCSCLPLFRRFIPFIHWEHVMETNGETTIWTSSNPFFIGMERQPTNQTTPFLFQRCTVSRIWRHSWGTPGSHFASVVLYVQSSFAFIL